jgi:hypothetical protein
MNTRELLEAYGYRLDVDGFWRRRVAGTVLPTHIWREAEGGWARYDPAGGARAWGYPADELPGYVRTAYRQLSRPGEPFEGVSGLHPAEELQRQAFAWVWPDDAVAEILRLPARRALGAHGRWDGGSGGLTMSTAARTRIQEAASELEAAAASLRDARERAVREEEARADFEAKLRELRAARAECAFEEMTAKWTGERISIDGDLELRLSNPSLIHDHDGLAIGVDVWVSLWNNGEEIPVDPHRRIINPPTLLTARNGDERTYVEDADAAVLTAVWESVRAAPNPMGWGTRGTVTTFYSDAGDGRIASYSSAFGSYSSARDGTANFDVDTTSTSRALGGQAYDGGSFTYLVYEGFISWNTAAIPDGDSITAATISLYGSQDASDTDFTLEIRSLSWTGGGLTSADFVPGGSLSIYTLVADFNTSTGWSTTSYNNLNSYSALLSAINKTGTTAVFVSSNRTRNNNSPTGDEFVSAYYADSAGTTQDPMLTVTHAAAGQPYAKRLGGVPGMLHRQRPGPHIW